MKRDQCFFIEPTSRVRMSLRRYRTRVAADGKLATECSIHVYHSCSAVIGDAEAAAMPRQYEGTPVHGDLWPHEDERWPTHCDCGYQFGPDDEWQFNPDTLYRRVDTGEIWTERSAPAGAMRDAASWLANFKSGYRAGHDGMMLQCKLPDGMWWTIDGPASNAPPDQPGWTRTGEVPDITARPSIATPGYHGFLTAGYLEEC